MSFDDYSLKLGDVMRGERATLGKSLLDVQRELRIKASYIAAIENCDPAAFDTPGFIAGYVRSYARYLGMDPDEAFANFCRESGFSVAHGMSQAASVVRKTAPVSGKADSIPRNVILNSKLPFAPQDDGIFSRVEPGAIGSLLVLLALICGIGYGGWAVLREVQRVQVTPVEQTPTVLGELDPLEAANPIAEEQAAGPFTPPGSEVFDRLYRPQALDVPVLVARDAPISTLDPDRVGVFAHNAGNDLPQIDVSIDMSAALRAPVLAPSGIELIATRPGWVEVKDTNGTTVLSQTMQAGDIVDLPAGIQSPRLIAGEGGGLYFNLDGTIYGPAGQAGYPVADVALSRDALARNYSPVLAEDDVELVAVMTSHDRLKPVQNMVAPDVPASPRVFADERPGVTVVAVEETWVEVTSPSGKTLLAKLMQSGDTYHVPQTDQPPVIFSGNASGVYFAVNGQTYGPYGAHGEFGRDLPLSAEAVTGKMQVADITDNSRLAKVVAELNLSAAAR